MNKNKFFFIIIIIIFTSALIIITVRTYNKTEKIVFVDLQKVYKEFKMKTEIEKEAETILQSRQLMLDSLLTNLKSRETEVNKTKDKELIKQFDKDKENYFQKKQYFDNSSQQIIEHYNGKIWEKIQYLSIDFAKSKGYDILLGKGAAQAFVYGNEKLDCTNSFIEYINLHYCEKK